MAVCSVMRTLLFLNHMTRCQSYFFIKVTRPSGQTNPKYESTYVFTNDFPALLEECPDPPKSEDPLFVTEAAKGTCRVMCFSPKSNITLPLMAVVDIVKVTHHS